MNNVYISVFRRFVQPYRGQKKRCYREDCSHIVVHATCCMVSVIMTHIHGHFLQPFVGYEMKLNLPAEAKGV